MKLTTSVFSALVALALSAQAATITVNNFPANTPVPVSDAQGSGILSNGTVAIGIFEGDINALAGAQDIAGIQAAFRQFGNSVAIGVNDPLGLPGLYQNSISGTVGGSEFSGQNVYTVIGNGSDVQGGSPGLLVFDHGFAFVDEPGATMDAILRADGNLILGTEAQADVGGNTFDGFQLAGAVIPEPSSAMLGLMGLSFLFLRRRK